MSHDPAALQADRAALRARWYREGWFRAETVAQRLLRVAREKPDTPFWFHSEDGLRQSCTREIVDEGQRLGSALSTLGIRPGDVVAFQLPTRYETAVLYVAAFFAGAVLLPIVHIYGPAETGFILRRARARALVVPDRWRGIDYLERLAGYGDTPDLEHLIVVGERVPPGALSYAQFAERGIESFQPITCNADDLCLLLFTSGTTGEPKGVRHTHNTLCCEWEIPFLESTGRYLNPSPAGHIQGFNAVFRPMVWGMPTVMMDRWNPVEAATLVERLGVQQTGGAPYFLTTLLEAAAAGGHDLSSLQRFMLGGAAVTSEHVRLAARYGFLSGRAYGLTEHPTVSSFRDDMPLDKRATTEGRVQPGTEIRFVDDDDRELPPGAEGEILLRGPEQFAGYLDPAHDAACYAAGGWFRTGDIGRLDAEGYLSITDRKKDLIIRGGENVSSLEVENLLLLHPAIAEVAVVAIPDARYGETVCACVVLRTGTELSLEAVKAHCAEAGFARQKTPEALVVMRDLPRTPSGKVRKAELRAHLHEVADQPDNGRVTRNWRI